MSKDKGTASRRPKSTSSGLRQADDKEQSKLFIEAARELGCDEDPAHFDEILKKVARHKPPPNAPAEPKKSKTKKPG
jgi:hypothetical protein